MVPGPEDDDLETYWSELRKDQPKIKLARNDLPSIMEMATAKTTTELQEWLRKHPGPLDLPAMVAQGVQMFWHHLTTDLKHIDTVGLIEVILSTQGLPAPELKTFVRALPRTLLERIVQSELGASAGGIHALLSLEVLFRDGRESDYTLTAMPSGGVEVAVQPRNRNVGELRFRLDESFSLQSPGGVESNREEPPNAAEP